MTYAPRSPQAPRVLGLPLAVCSYSPPHLPNAHWLSQNLVAMHEVTQCLHGATGMHESHCDHKGCKKAGKKGEKKPKKRGILGGNSQVGGGDTVSGGTAKAQLDSAMPALDIR